ncbi:MAG: amidase [Rhodospirillaceae bacterium]
MSAEHMLAVDDTVGAWVPHGRFVLDGAPHGRLQGLRFAVKDVYDVAGHPTGAGNPAWLATHPIPTSHAPVVRMLLDAGATLTGKTVTDELAYSIHGDNKHYGTPVNSNAPDRVAGGSSSGSAAAVAAALVDFALGTDTGGSTRVPASYCGIWGLRTTHGRLPVDGMVPLHPSFDTATWFAHEAGTFARVADVLTPMREATSFRKVVRLEEPCAEADAVYTPWVGRVADVLANLLGARAPLGLKFGEDLEWWRRAYVTAGAHEAWQLHGPWIAAAKPDFAPAIASRWAYAASVSSEAAAAARADLATVRTHVRGMLGLDTIAVLPSAASFAPLRNASGAEVEEARTRTLRITCIAGIGGLPQVSIPCRTTEGLPLGISLLGPAGRDGELVRLAIAVWRDMQQGC